MIVKADGSFAALIGSVLTPTLGPWDIVTRRNGVIIIVIGHNIAPANDTQHIEGKYQVKVHLHLRLIFRMFETKSSTKTLYQLSEIILILISKLLFSPSKALLLSLSKALLLSKAPPKCPLLVLPNLSIHRKWR